MDEQTQRLRIRAENILNQLSAIEDELREKRRLPIFIEFAGSPKSGKSTCIDTITHFFRRTNFNILAPTEGASKRTPYYLKHDWLSFNVWSASYALTHILEGLYGSDKYQLAILDRGLFDALAWFELLHMNDSIDETVRDTIQNFLLLDKWRTEIDAVFLFKADPPTSLKRENQNTLIDEPGSAMNEKVLSKLNEAYATVKDQYSHYFSQLIEIDTSDSLKTTVISTSIEVAVKILDVFDKELSS